MPKKPVKPKSLGGVGKSGGTHVFYHPIKVTVQTRKTAKKTAKPKAATTKKPAAKKPVPRKTTAKTGAKKTTAGKKTAPHAQAETAHSDSHSSHETASHSAHEHREKTVREIFEDERKKFIADEAHKKEHELREKIRDNLKQVEALEAAVKFQKFTMLVINDHAFRKKMGLYSMDEIKKLKRNPAEYERAKAEAKKNNLAWANDPNFLRGHEPRIAEIERRAPEMARKMNWESIFQKALGNKFEALWKSLGLQRLTNIPVNPSKVFQIATIRQLREHYAKKHWLMKANTQIILDRYRGRLEYWKEKEAEMNRSNKKI